MNRSQLISLVTFATVVMPGVDTNPTGGEPEKNRGVGDPKHGGAASDAGTLKPLGGIHDLNSSLDLSFDDPSATVQFDSDSVASKETARGNTPHSELSSKHRTNTNHKLSSPSGHSAHAQIPGFTLQGELGRGAFGVVYRAYDEMLDRNVAVKMPLLNDPSLRQQYIDEARKAVRLEHPSIVPTYHVGVTPQGQPFVVQKLIEGQTLRELLVERGGAISLGEAIAVLRPVCLALESAHTIGMIHRDLKPENLLIDQSGKPYVADFGLAVSEEEDLTGRKDVAGTPLYMSPEQFDGRTQWLDGRSDIWALGVIFYEVLVGRVPFQANTVRELKEQIRERDPKPIHQRQPSIPPSFDAIFRRCCAKQTSERFGSVREMIDAIDEAIRLLPEDSVLDLLPSLNKGVQSNSQNYTSSTKRKTTSFISTQHATLNGRPKRYVQIWNVVGPVMAMLCSMVAVVLVISLAMRDAVRPTLAPNPSTIDNSASIPAETIQADGKVPMDGASISQTPSTPSVTLPLITQGITPRKQKPFRVSLRADGGTHENLSAAIADSDADDTIFIAEGVYREAIVIDKNISIVGEGEKHNTVVQAEGKSCFLVRDNAILKIDNFKLKTNRLGESEANTIDVQAGQVFLNNCYVISNSYDCVKLDSACKLTAKNTDFQSSDHATIRAEKQSWIDIDDCDFLLHPDSPDSMRKVCIQAEGAAGKIKGSRFKGPCMAGIEWHDQSDDELTVEGCSFVDIRLALSLSNCHRVILSGDNSLPLTFKNCEDAIWLRNCKAQISGTQITGNLTNLKKGIAIENQSDATIQNCMVSSYKFGIVIDRSKIAIRDSNIRECGDTNIKLQSSDAVLEDVELIGSGPFCLHAEGNHSTLSFTGGLVANSASGMWLAIEESDLHQVHVRDCQIGILAGVNRKFSKELSESDTTSMAVVDDEKDTAVHLRGTGITFSKCGKGVVFIGPGELAFPSVVDEFQSDSRRRLSVFSKELSGIGDFSKFKAEWKSIRDRSEK